MSYLGYNESRSYNAMKQLTRLTASGSGGVDFGYSFPSSQGIGEISQMQDYVTGETIGYQYDALLRLLSASSNQNWSQAFTYDGFSNLTNVNAVNAPGLGVNLDSATNRLLSDFYDASGNDISMGSYDGLNRLVSAGGATYAYAPDGKRVFKQRVGDPPGTGVYYYYAPNSQRLGTYYYSIYAPTQFTTVNADVYFGGQLIQAQGNTILTDQLGSNVSGGKRYFPYGGEKPSATTNEIEKFTGYFRDSETGLDYADQRYYQPGMGRFSSTDPSQPHGNDPQGWNRYAYADGDPINRRDPSGLDWEWLGPDGWCSTLDPDGGCYDPTDNSDCAAPAGLAWMNIGGFEQECPGVQPVAPVSSGINLGPSLPPVPGDVQSDIYALMNQGWINQWSCDTVAGSCSLSFVGTVDGVLGVGMCTLQPEICGAIALSGAIIIAPTPPSNRWDSSSARN